jgi:KUP system potassium uptake protein
MTDRETTALDRKSQSTNADISSSIGALTLAALGVVFGDIGTSPLYAFKEVFNGHSAIPLATDNVFGVLSMMFWAVTLIVSIKYVLVMLRFDNRGEGGVLALMSFAAIALKDRQRLNSLIAALGVFAASLFYGDAVITPAISVLSAIEGISVVAPQFERLIVPIALLILIGLFMVQKTGTAIVGAFFGPVMIVWFLVLAATGIYSIAQTPTVLYALNPMYAIGFIVDRPGVAFMACSAVFLCLTGAEAMYADLGHFGRKPIRFAWFFMVFPPIMLNYFGQAALVIRNPAAVKNPFFNLVPETLALPLVLLATFATVIASQATISGAFSVTQQASRLNFLPRLKVLHTSDTAHGQIYIPLVNWSLLVLVCLLVVSFRSSEKLAAAYGIAVSLDLLIGSLILLIVLPLVGPLRLKFLWALVAFFALIEVIFFSANAAKFWEGGWFPIALAAVMFTVMTTWRSGLEMMQKKKEAAPKSDIDGLTLDLSDVFRVEGTAVFFSSTKVGCPSSFLHNLKHNKVVHEQTLFVTVDFLELPYVKDEDRLQITRGANGIFRVLIQFGFREEPDLTFAIKQAQTQGLAIDINNTSFFTSKPTIVSAGKRGLFGWRQSLFGSMLQNSASVASYFNLPPNRVIELGVQVAI